MFVPVWFLLAWLVWSFCEFLREPPLPQDGDHALPILCLLVASILLYYIVVMLVELVLRRLGRADHAMLRGVLALRPVLPLGFFLALLLAGGWDAFVRFEVAGSNLFLYCVVSLAPYLLFELLTVLGEILLKGRADAAIDRIRPTWLIAPILFLIVGWTALAVLHPWTRAALYELELFRYVLWGLGFFLSFVLLPSWFVRLFRTRAVESQALRAELDGMAERAGVGLRGVRVLETRGRSLNAAVLGPVSWTRRVLLTDLLIARFLPQQVRAVFAHEIAHAQRHHGVRQILFFVLLPLVLTAVIFLVAENLLEEPGEAAIMIVFAGVLAVFVPIFRWLRHRYEHEADLFGARIAGSVGDMVSALREVDSLYPGRSHKASLMHPSTARRIEFLERAAQDESFLAGWLRRTFRLQAQLFLVLGLGLIACIPSLWQRTENAWPGFLLASGYPERAYDACLALGDELSPQQRRDLDQASRALLVAYDVPPGAAGTRVLRRRALRRAERALSDQHWSSAHSWYGLARRLGDCGEAVDAMFAYLEADATSDYEGMSRAKALLRSLPLPAEIRRAVGSLPSG